MRIDSIEELDDALSRPTEGALDSLRKLDGDFLVAGAGGKMGPTLARMIRRGLDAIGRRDSRVVAVSRFSNPAHADALRALGVETIACDLLNRDAVAALPRLRNLIFMAGQKFGTRDAPDLTWAMNTLVPSHVAEHFGQSRTVVFSTGCVYPLMPVDGPGADENTPLTPPGEYANSCVGRERIFEFHARRNGAPLLLFRLCYAIDLRYGVLLDVAQKVAAGQAVDVTMGHAHVIWQGDANARAIQALERAASPAVAVNVTGQQRVSIRDLALRFGGLLGREPRITGQEAPLAWVWDARRCKDWFGPLEVGLDSMIEATAHWVKRGGDTLGKPTHFEVRDGEF
jgi:nucleoside-diphosphate-sugar epimerase